MLKSSHHHNTHDETYQMGKLWLYGEGGNQDQEKGLSTLHSLPSTHYSSQLVLALYYRDTPHLAIQHAQHAAQHIHAQPQAWLLYASLLEKQGHTTQAIQWYCQAADKGITAAALKAGTLLSSENPTRSLHYMHVAAEGGNAHAQCLYAQQVRDPVSAYTWMQLAATQHDMYACYMLYEYLLRGYGCTKNIKQAHTWLIQAAELGYDKAQDTCEENDIPFHEPSHVPKTPTSEAHPRSSISASEFQTTPLSTTRSHLTAAPSSSSSSSSSPSSTPRSVFTCINVGNVNHTKTHDMEMNHGSISDVDSEVDEEDDVCPMFHDE